MTKHDKIVSLLAKPCPFHNGKFPCLKGVPDFEAALAGIRRILKPGGKHLTSHPACRTEHPVQYDLTRRPRHGATRMPSGMTMLISGIASAFSGVCATPRAEDEIRAAATTATAN